MTRDPDERARPGPHGGLITLCAGRTRHDHVPCRNPAVRGRHYCRLHGGKIPVGARSARFKHGRYSRFVTNPDLQARLEAIEADPKINSLRDNIVLVDARISQVIERLDGRSVLPRWEEARELMVRYIDALDAESPCATTILNQMQRILDEGADELEGWCGIAQQTELRRRLTETEARSLEKLGGKFTIEEAVVFVRALAAVAREFVPPEQLGQFVARLKLLTAGDPGGRPVPREAARPGCEP
jgi:hypothetical protein